MGYIAWELDKGEVATLMGTIRPAYPDVIAHHVTYAFGVDETHPLPADTVGHLIGIVDDGEGVQAVVVEINDTTARADGSTYHVTWSIDRDRGRKPVHSNDVIRKLGWEKLVFRVPVTLTAKYYR